ncbi:MAG: UDP-glucose dehydrogenase family protein, partial [Candidatus Methylomirabilales bacterium]
VGYVGLVTATCFAHMGNKVIGVDDDRQKIKLLEQGNIPIYEPLLDQMVANAVKEGRLVFTEYVEEGVRSCQVVFICVGTPPLDSGEADLSSVEGVARRIAEVAEGYKLIVEKSTVPVQTGLWIEKTLRSYSRAEKSRFDVASNPEFLREGSAVEDFLHPDRIVVGVQSEGAERTLRALYDPVIRGLFHCPVHQECPKRGEVPFLVTDIASAELIKHASNSFLAMKVSYINVIADLCERVGADVLKVAEGMGLDRRIGRAFLNAGIGFGGFCFPKDVQAFIRIGEKYGCDLSLLREVERINRERIDVVLRKLQDHLCVLRGKTIAVLGLSFKPDTDDIRFAPAVELIRRLQEEGADVRTYDPKAMPKAQEVLESVQFCADPYGALDSVDAGVIVTEWEEFKRLDLLRVKQQMRRPLIIDGRNIFDRKLMESLEIEYSGIGR